ncbi:MAG: PQQ-binding-like beta-propeller repeat protein, partial [Chloroflexota bacterium]|nr:PQQ-binding-like beta-propeller repeat protein [Chloroflexota bacterium]
VPLPAAERPPAATAPAEIALGNAARPLRRRWQWQVPGGIHRAAPVCHGSALLVSQQDEAYPVQSGLACLELATGQLRWQVRTDAVVKNSVAVASPPAGGQRKGEAGSCVAVSVTGRVSAFSLGEGELLWQAEVPSYPDQSVCTSPVVADGVVYVAATDSCVAYDLETGRRLWHTPLSPGTGRSYAEPQLYADLLIVMIPSQGVLALRRADGAIAWQRPFPVKYYCAGPVVVGDRLVCAGDGGDLAVLAARSGETIWERPGLLGSYAAGLAADTAHIYVTTVAGEAQSYTLHSGRRRWRFQAGEALLAMTCYRRQGRSLLAAPVRWRDYVVVGGLDGWLYLLDEASGTCVGRAAFGSPISAAPCPTAAGLCVGTYDGRLLLYAE